MHQACGNRRLVTEISREVQNPESWIGLVLPSMMDRERSALPSLTPNHLPVEAIESTAHLSQATRSSPRFSSSL
jgi:hypothetical protein